MTDDLTKKAAEAIHDLTDEPMGFCVVIARAVLGALDLPGLLNAAKAEAWDESVESAFLCENHPAYAVHIEHAANPYRPEEGNDRG